MKKVFATAVVFALATVVSATTANADLTLSFGDVPLAPGGASSSLSGSATGAVTSIDVLFDYQTSTDGSWSSDYVAVVTDPSGDVIILGDGLVSGDIDYSSGTPIGASQNDSTAGGSFGTSFDVSLIQAVVSSFGEAGTYSAFFADGWTGGSSTEVLGNATVVVHTSAVPEPTSALALLGLTGLVIGRRRR